MSDAVNHPPHYNVGRIEVIDAIEDWRLDFHLGNVVKYLARAGHKGSERQDLEKAAWYLQRRIEALRKEQEAAEAAELEAAQRAAVRALDAMGFACPTTKGN